MQDADGTVRLRTTSVNGVKMARMSRVSSAFVLLSVTVLLVGCESYANGPAAISRDEQELLIALCKATDVVEIYGETSSPSGVSPVVDLAGLAELESEVVIRSGSIPGGLEGTFGVIEFSSLNSVSLKVVATNLGNGFSATFGNGRDLLKVPEDAWLQTDGTETIDACP